MSSLNQRIPSFLLLPASPAIIGGGYSIPTFELTRKRTSIGCGNQLSPAWFNFEVGNNNPYTAKYLCATCEKYRVGGGDPLNMVCSSCGERCKTPEEGQDPDCDMTPRIPPGPPIGFGGFIEFHPKTGHWLCSREKEIYNRTQQLALVRTLLKGFVMGTNDMA